jgi:hypothetical protein
MRYVLALTTALPGLAAWAMRGAARKMAKVTEEEVRRAGEQESRRA